MIVYLARHGQTESNLQGRLMGTGDSPLTQAGLKSAATMGQALRGVGFGTIHSSPLGRATTTVRIITTAMAESVASHKIHLSTPQLHQSLAELSCGSWQGLLRSQILSNPKIIRANWFDKPPQGESYQDGSNRLAPFLERLRNTTHRNPVLVVSHNSINRVFLKLWLGLDEDTAMNIAHPHEVAYILTDDTQVKRIRTDGQIRNGLLWED